MTLGRSSGRRGGLRLGAGSVESQLDIQSENRYVRGRLGRMKDGRVSGVGGGEAATYSQLVPS